MSWYWGLFLSAAQMAQAFISRSRNFGEHMRGGLCWYCSVNKATTGDHFYPRSLMLKKRGGAFIRAAMEAEGPAMTIPCCRACNNLKGDRLIFECANDMVNAFMNPPRADLRQGEGLRRQQLQRKGERT
jgi:hypothetical protein